MSKLYTINIDSKADHLATVSSVDELRDELKDDCKNLSDVVIENEKIIVSLAQRYENFLDVQEKHQATLREYRQNSNRINELLTESIQRLSENQNILSQNHKDSTNMLRCLIDANEYINHKRFKRWMWFFIIFGTLNIANIVLLVIKLFFGG